MEEGWRLPKKGTPPCRRCKGSLRGRTMLVLDGGKVG